MKHIRTRALPLVVGASLLLTACGGDDGDTTQEPTGAGTTTDQDATGDTETDTPTSTGTETTAAGNEAECADIGTVRIGLTNSSSDAPFFIADANGYFEDADITPEFSEFNSAAQMIAPLGAGQLDVGAGAPSAGFYNALTRDIAFKVVADKGSMPDGYGYMPLLAAEGSGITEVADLEGKTVAEPAPGTATSSTLHTILQSAGLTYDDVNHEFIGFGEHVAAYQNGAIDASLTTEPNATVIESEGLAIRLGTPPDWYDNQQLAVILYSESFTQNEQAATCTMIAYLQGVRDYVGALKDGAIAEDADEVVQIVSDATGLDPELYRQITPNWVDPDGQVNEASMAQDYEFFQSQGLLEGEVDLTQVVDSSFADAAVEQLGAWDGERP